MINSAGVLQELPTLLIAAALIMAALHFPLPFAKNCIKLSLSHFLCGWYTMFFKSYTLIS